MAFVKFPYGDKVVYVDPDKITHLEGSLSGRETYICFGEGFTTVTMPIDDVLATIQEATKVES